MCNWLHENRETDQNITNKMEERILHLLNDYPNPIENINQTAIINHNNELISNAGRNLAQLIVQKLKNNSTNASQYTSYIQEICHTKIDHFNTNESNYEVYLKSLPISKKVNDDFHDFKLTTRKDRNNNNEIKHYYMERERRMKAKQEHRYEIRERDRKSFKSLVYTPFKSTESSEITMQMIANLQEKEQVEGTADDTEQQRKSLIKLGYAVLHLNSINKNTIVHNILDKLAKYDHKYDYEKEFLTFLFNKEYEYEDKLLLEFPFILETLLIKVCCDVAQEKDINIDFVKRIIDRNPRRRNVITQICYKLFSLLDYDEKLLEMVKFVKNI